jgi:hypothetical protein
VTIGDADLAKFPMKMIYRKLPKTASLPVTRHRSWPSLSSGPLPATTLSYSASMARWIMFRVSALAGKSISRWVPSLCFLAGIETK